MRAFSAKVAGRSLDGEGGWGGLEAREEKGLGDEDEAEAKGFGAEKGFALLEEELALPKMLSPSMGGGAC